MFAFELWGSFAAFRDPLTITQNLTLPIPPKTTVGGMLAAILGLDYTEYFNDDEFFNFEYSIIIKKTIRKYSFAQNYIKKYTERSSIKEGGFKAILSDGKLSKKGELSLHNFFFTVPKEPDYKVGTKPIYRELILNPKYIIIINNFKYEEEILPFLLNHNSSYPLYMGNTEFAGNYNLIDIESVEISTSEVSSFTIHADLIQFEAGKKYTPVYAATKVTGNREYRDYRKLVISDGKIKLKENIKGYQVKTKKEEYTCEFI